MGKNDIPVCPLVSIGSGIIWYVAKQNVLGMFQVFKNVQCT